jgi:hypothetical protein
MTPAHENFGELLIAWKNAVEAIRDLRLSDDDSQCVIKLLSLLLLDNYNHWPYDVLDE